MLVAWPWAPRSAHTDTRVFGCVYTVTRNSARSELQYDSRDQSKTLSFAVLFMKLAFLLNLFDHAEVLPVIGTIILARARAREGAQLSSTFTTRGLAGARVPGKRGAEHLSSLNNA